MSAPQANPEPTIVTNLTSDQAFEVIESIADAKGKAKQLLLGEYINDRMMRDVLKHTYDPFITYGIKQVPKPTAAGTDEFTTVTWQLLWKLRDRELTGNAAKQAIQEELDKLTEASQTLLTRILKKDLRAGFTANTCNKVEPAFIFVFECMLAHKFEEKRIKRWPVAAEPKYDGVRSLAIWNGTQVTFYSRTGKVFEGMGPIARQLEARFKRHGMAPMVLDGELMDRNNSFNQIVGDVHKKDFEAENAVFYVFEAMHLEEFEQDTVKGDYTQRRRKLVKLYNQADLATLPCLRLTPVRILDCVEAIQSWADDIMQAGGEGLIVKPLDGEYQKKRSHNWLKIKGEHSVDLVVTGIEPGTGKYEGKIGALLVDFQGVTVNVGSGLTDALRDKPGDHFVGRLIEVKYHEVTPDKSLRHPRFIRFRDDKPMEDGPGV